jgi:dipeptidyl aminopeptidase/acylaminoacyl peptidase
VAHSGENSTPTLIGHGLADTRVHPEQSLELYTALKLAGVPTELVLYPREPHALNERAHQLDYMGRIVEWMDRYLQPEGRPVTQP